MKNAHLIFLVSLVINQAVFTRPAKCENHGGQDFSSTEFSSFPSGCVELVMWTVNTSGWETFYAKAQSPVWDSSLSLTTNCDSSAVSTYGDQRYVDVSNITGWDFVTSTDCVGHRGGVLGYGVYKISWSENKYIFLDYRDSRYPHGDAAYHSLDVWLKFDVAQQSWSYSVEGRENTYTTISNHDSVGIWTIFGVSGSRNTNGFQPTDPASLEIPNQSGHPQLRWHRSQPSGSAKYYVYRNNSLITPWVLSDSTFVDQDVVITQGLPKSYKVRATSGDSTKLSANYSNVVTVTGVFLKQATTTSSLSVTGVELYGSYPNPFNPQTTIRYFLSDAVFVTLDVTDMLGRQVAVIVDAEQAFGEHEVGFDGSKLPTGMYFCRLRAGDDVVTKKMFLLK